MRFLIHGTGFIYKRVHRYVYILLKGGERRKLMKNIKHPIFPYPKENEEFVEEIHRMDPINLEIRK